MTYRILVIDDDAQLRCQLDATLKNAGYGTVLTGSFTDALRVIQRHPPHVILLDLTLPDARAAHWIAELNRAHRPARIITMAPAYVPPPTPPADDHLIKAFSGDELLARVSVQVRRGAQPVDVGALHVDPSLREICWNARRITLSTREYDLLSVLFRQPGRAMTREDIEHALGLREATRHVTLNQAIASIRRKFQEAGAPDLIRTIRGVGYAVCMDYARPSSSA